METQSTETRTTDYEAVRERRINGIVLIVLGLFFLLAQQFSLGFLTLPILSAGFLAAGIGTRKAGWLIPGGILAGISLGVFVTERFGAQFGENVEGGLFLLAFSLGWVGIYVLSRLFTREPQRWALIPGGIMAVVGAAVLAQGPALQLLRLGNLLWPLALIGFGCYMIFLRKRA